MSFPFTDQGVCETSVLAASRCANSRSRTPCRQVANAHRMNRLPKAGIVLKSTVSMPSFPIEEILANKVQVHLFAIVPHQDECPSLLVLNNYILLWQPREALRPELPAGCPARAAGKADAPGASDPRPRSGTPPPAQGRHHCDEIHPFNPIR